MVKGHTGDLFLLSEIVVAALSLGLPDMKSLVGEVVCGLERRTGCDRVTQLDSGKSTVTSTGILLFREAKEKVSVGFLDNHKPQ